GGRARDVPSAVPAAPVSARGLRAGRDRGSVRRYTERGRGRARQRRRRAGGRTGKRVRRAVGLGRGAGRGDSSGARRRTLVARVERGVVYATRAPPVAVSLARNRGPRLRSRAWDERALVGGECPSGGRLPGELCRPL